MPARPAVGTVVMVHGMVVAGRGTMPLALALAVRGLEVHVPDLPGFGRSSKPARALDVSGLGRALVAWMSAEVGGSVVLVGNSFGTQVAASAASEAGPDRVSALVLVAPTIDARFRGAWIRWLPPGRQPNSSESGARRRWRRWLVDRLIPDEPGPPAGSLGTLSACEYLAAGPARAVSTYRHALRDDLVQTVSRLPRPVLVLRGADDRLVSPGWANAVAMAAPLGAAKVVTGVDHDAQFEHPDRLADEIADFLTHLPGQSKLADQ